VSKLESKRQVFGDLWQSVALHLSGSISRPRFKFCVLVSGSSAERFNPVALYPRTARQAEFFLLMAPVCKFLTVANDTWAWPHSERNRSAQGFCLFGWTDLFVQSLPETVKSC
jgi:hypothetical protein